MAEISDHDDALEAGVVPEYSFDEGVRAAIARIEELLAQQDFVVVGVEGSAPSVGKTFVTGSLANYFHCNEIAISITSRGKVEICGALRTIEYLKSSLKAKKGLLIIEGAGIESAVPLEKVSESRKAVDNNLGILLARAGVPNGKFDLLISIYRPDRPFRKMGPDARPLGDIVICNEKARNSR
jgi:hypothetical protein